MHGAEILEGKVVRISLSLEVSDRFFTYRLDLESQKLDRPAVAATVFSPSKSQAAN